MSKNNPSFIIVHCSDVSERDIYNQLKSIDQYHKTRDFDLSKLGYYVGYHALITGGQLYRTRLDEEEGCHCNQNLNGMTMNVQSLGICVGFDGDIEFPNQKHYDLLKEQVLKWQTQHKISNDRVLFHRHFATNKTCPGSLIKQDWLDTLLTSTPVTVPKVPEQADKQKEIQKIQDQISIFTKLLIQLQALYNQLYKK